MIKRTLIIHVFFTVFFVLPINCCELILPAPVVVALNSASACQRTLDDSVDFVRTIQFHPKCSIGLEYTLNDQSKNPWGDLSMNVGCAVFNNKNSGHVAFRLNYENKYGLLGSWGHVHGKVDAHHPNKAIDACAQIIVSDLNTVIDYNPETIARNARLIAQLKKQKEQQDNTYLEKQARSLAAKKSSDNFAFSINRQIFLSHKAAFESRPFDENNPKHIEMKRMLEELEEIYGSE